MGLLAPWFLAGLAAGYTVVGPGNVVTATGNNVLAPGDSVVVTIDGQVSAPAFPSRCARRSSPTGTPARRPGRRTT